MMDVKEVILSLPLILHVLEKNENSNILFVASEYKCLMSSFDEMSGFFFKIKTLHLCVVIVCLLAIGSWKDTTM